MELVVYFFLVLLISVGSFWLVGFVYGLLHRPAILFPLSLAAKMAFCAVFGAMLFVVGGVVLSTLVFNGEMSKRADHRLWPTLLSGAVISVLCSGVIYVSIVGLAWKILG